MPRVVYVGSHGEERAVDVQLGDTVMSAAVRNGIPGVVGECGGQLSCATCHVWVRSEFRELVGGPGAMEADLLDLGVSDYSEASRLGCQILVTEELDGIVVEPRAEAWH